MTFLFFANIRKYYSIFLLERSSTHVTVFRMSLNDYNDVNDANLGVISNTANGFVLNSSY